MVQGGGGRLECRTCRSRRTYKVGDTVAAIGLHTRGYNHQVGVVASSVQREGGVRYGVRLAGQNGAVGIRPENLRPARCNAVQLADPGYRDKPRERGVGSRLVEVHRGAGNISRSANVVTFK